MLAGKKNTLRANTKNPGNNFPIPHENSGLQNCHETSKKQLCDGGVGGVTHLFTHRGLCRKKRSFYLHVVVASCVFECSRSHLHSCDRAAAVKVTETGGNVMAAFKIIMCTAGAYLYERQGLHYCGREA